MEKLKEVVGTLFFNDNKLLIDKPRKRNTYQMIGGSVEENESILDAAIRECHEELGDNAIFNEKNFKLIMQFNEIATSDPNLKIHMNIFIYEGFLEGNITTSEEIEAFCWYDTSRTDIVLSNTLKNEIIPYCIENKLID